MFILLSKFRRATLCLFFCIVSMQWPSAQTSSTDSLLMAFRQATTAPARAQAAGALFTHFHADSSPSDTLLKYLQLEEQFAAESRDQRLIGMALKNRGHYCLIKVDYKVALDAFSQARLIFHENDMISDEAYCLTYLGNLFLITGNYPKSIQLLLEAEPLAQKARDKKTLSFLYTTLSLINMQMNSSQKAIDYGLLAVKYAQEANANFWLSQAYRALGYAYEGAGDMANTERCHKESVRLTEIDRQPIRRGYALLDLADYFFETGRPDSAWIYYQIVQKTVAAPRASPLKCYLFTSLASYFLSQNLPTRALAVADTAFALAVSLPLPASKVSALILGAEARFALNQPSKAYLMLKEASTLEDSLTSVEKKSKIEELQTTFLLGTQAREFELKNEQIRSRSQIVMASMVMAVLFILLLLYILRIKFRSFKLLDAQKQLVTEQNIELDKANQIKARLLSIISHDLRAPLYKGANLLSQMAHRNIRPEDASSLRIHFSQTILFMENLLFWAKNQRRQTHIHITKVNLYHLATQIPSIYQLDCREKELSVTNIIPPETVIWTDERLLHILLNNLFSNAIHNAPSKTAIIMESCMNEDGVWIDVVNKALPGSFTDLFSRASSDYPELEFEKAAGSSGFGLYICKEMAQLLGGSLTLIPAAEPDECRVRIFLGT